MEWEQYLFGISYPLVSLITGNPYCVLNWFSFFKFQTFQGGIYRSNKAKGAPGQNPKIPSGLPSISHSAHATYIRPVEYNSWNDTSHACLEADISKNTATAFLKKWRKQSCLGCLFWKNKNKKSICVNHETLHRIQNPAKCKIVQERVAVVCATLSCSRAFLSEN